MTIGTNVNAPKIRRFGARKSQGMRAVPISRCAPRITGSISPSTRVTASPTRVPMPPVWALMGKPPARVGNPDDRRKSGRAGRRLLARRLHLLVHVLREPREGIIRAHLADDRLRQARH